MSELASPSRAGPGERQQRRPLLPRLHLFEIEDQSWCPTFLRDYATDYLRLVQTWIGMSARVAPQVLAALDSSGANRIVDLCSGGAGPIVELAVELERGGHPVQVILTDKFPNLDAFERARLEFARMRLREVTSSEGLCDEDEARFSFRKDPIDATSVPGELDGLRTLFNALHHFRPAAAVRVLADAVDAGQPIAAFEVSQRTVASLVRMLAVPLLVLLLTPRIRPFLWRRLLWTYLLPAVPLLCLWDGAVSQLRAYSPAELRAFATAAVAESKGSPEKRGYHWQCGTIRFFGGEISYLTGVPTKT